MAVTAVNLLHELADVRECWTPRVVGRVNDQYVKVAKLKGQLAWHKHDLEDELFQVLKGRLVIQLEDGELTLNSGEFCVIPRGVMHNPVAEEECWIMLVETITTLHTGDVLTPLTKTIEQQLSR
jgi:quercetin dioxygenase-like cupin family protein